MYREPPAEEYEGRDYIFLRLAEDFVIKFSEIKAVHKNKEGKYDLYTESMGIWSICKEVGERLLSELPTYYTET